MASERNDKPEVNIGDLVQVEIDGALALEKPARVRAVQEYDGSPWVFVEGSETGIPMDQIVLQEKGRDEHKPPLAPPRLSEDKRPDPPPVPLGVRQEIFALDEGDVVITFPDNLSADSFSDLEDYLEVFVKKMKRRAGVATTVTSGQIPIRRNAASEPASE